MRATPPNKPSERRVTKPSSEPKKANLAGLKNTAMAKQKSNAPNPEKQLLDSIVHGILEKKGKDVLVVNLKGLHNAITDYFIIATGDSNTQVEAIANSVHEEVKKATGENPFHTEGYINAEWILLDYVNMVVHVFQPEARSFYQLEKLWSDGEVEHIAS